MDLRCDISLGANYTSRSQIARVLTESWCSGALYCPACPSNRIERTRANTQALDFVCLHCDSTFEVKSMKSRPGYRINDSAYTSMMAAIRRDNVPNLLVLHYSPNWWIENLLLVPRFFFTESIIEKRNPLAATARRAGWVGCNILLG